MLPKNNFLNIIILILTFNISLSLKSYTHYDYDQIISAFTDLSKTCSHYIKIDTSQKRYNLDTIKDCGKGKCQNLIVFLTDFDSYTLDRPSYYISSSLHGDEVIGAPSLVEFAKYFCDTYETKRNSLYHNILKTKLIIMTPMTNANGYYHKKRDEKVYISLTNKYEEVDPNRDFPYYNTRDEIKNCMRTISARTINEIFNEFIISGAITFHGGTNVLGYPWGNYLHIMQHKNQKKSTESPDFNAFDSIGKIMVKFSSSDKNEKNYIPKYEIGDMTSTVYPLDGALEDWAYGGWEKYEIKGNNNINPIKTCRPDSFNKNYSMIWNLTNEDYNDDYKLRCLIYLAEASERKKPDEKDYGINDFDLRGYSRDIFDFYKTNDFFGYIPRNMRLVYSGVDLISASIYLDINNIKKISEENNNLIKYNIPFLFMGCLTLKKYSVYKIPFEHVIKNIFTKEFFESNLNSSNLISEYNSDIKCYFKNNIYYNISINFPNNKTLRHLGKNNDPLHHFERPGGDYDYMGNVLGVKVYNLYKKKGNMYIIKGEGPDEEWAQQKNPDPNVKPQSHVVRSKINKDYFVKNGNHTLKSNYYFYSYPLIILDNNDEKSLRIVDDIDSLFYEDEFNFMKLIINSYNKDFDISSQIRFIKVDNNNILTSDNMFDVNLKIQIQINQNENSMVDIKNINLFSSIILLSNDTIDNMDLNCFCEANNEKNLYIKCTILKSKIGSYIRQILPNAILGFELKQGTNIFLKFYGIISIDGDNKGKYLDTNFLLCTNDFPFFIKKKKENQISPKDIYYKIDLIKISNNKLKMKFNVTINNDKYNNYVFVVLFPFCEEIFFFEENTNEEKEINLMENTDSKILGKTINIIPIEKNVYEKIKNSNNLLKNKNNDALEITLELNKIAKKSELYESIPCSIISYSSFSSEKSKKILKNLFSEYTVKINTGNHKYNINKKMNIYLITGLILGCILIILIIFIIVRLCTNASKYNNFEEGDVEISTSSNS